jgi:molybdate transport system ATP-binding protein
VILLDFVLEQGEFELELHERLAGRVTALFGPSGSGKTTTLDAIAGLRTPAAGEIRVGDRTLFARGQAIDLASHERHVGYVTQDVALFPHMHVRRNVLYGRRRQRVALARALMSAPELLLLDEPLNAIDLELRRRILPYLERVRDELAVPILYVTHDRDEVRQLADHVVVLEKGKVVSSGAGLP